MRKIAIAIFGIGTTLLSILPAEAQHYQNRNSRYQNHRYAPPVQHHHRSYNRNRWVGPAIVGGLALGLGGAIVYDRYRRSCWIEEQDVVDRYGRYLGTEDVRVCN
jgi:hypothetical protein